MAVNDATMKILAQNDVGKLNQFDGTNFTRWKDKIRFLLSAVKVYYVLDENLPALPAATPDDTDEQRAERQNREDDMMTCRGLILNSLTDRLYDLYSTLQTPREIWTALETKYQNEKRGTDKFLALNYFDFKMTDDKPVMDQIHELQIMTHLQIECETRIRDEKMSKDKDAAESSKNKSQVHMVGAKFGNKSDKSKSLKVNNKGFKKNSKSDKTCFHCGKKGHFIKECRYKKREDKKSGSSSKTNEANIVKDEDYVAVVIEVNAVVAASSDFFIDSGATIHICNNKDLFSSYVEDESEVFMGNQAAVRVVGKGNVSLNFTSGQKLTLVNVHHVPDVKRNLVSASLLVKRGFKILLESDKVVITKNGAFIGKGYSLDRLFKLSINEINSVSVYLIGSIYNVESSNLWNSRLGHLNYATLKYMASHDYFICKHDYPDKCEVCAQAKITRKPFPKAERETQILDLIHSDICELNGKLTRGGKRYFITFIDDCSRYVYVHLLKTKNEAFEAFKEFKAKVENQKERKIKVLRSDRGGEYFFDDFDEFCEEHGIIHQRTAPFTPQHNGVAERKNRTLVDMEALASRDAAFWQEAVNDEMDSIMANGTWVLVDLPPGSKPIKNKWVFRRKYNSDGSLQTFKARLVVKASIYKLHIHQMDVKTAFLNGDLKEEVYMEQPEGFVLPGNENKVCKLVKSLYGLKQAPKQWHEKFDIAILSFGFRHNTADKCIYSKFTSEYGVVICLYVDDMLIFGTNMIGINETKKFLTSVFKMKDLNEVDTILGIKVIKYDNKYMLSQSHYIEKLLNKFNYLKISDYTTPYESSVTLLKSNARPIEQLKYASAIGSLMYAMHCTRPDIAYAVSKLSRFTHNPSMEHWRAIERAAVVKQTKEHGHVDAGCLDGVNGVLPAVGAVSTGAAGSLLRGTEAFVADAGGNYLADDEQDIAGRRWEGDEKEDSPPGMLIASSLSRRILPAPFEIGGEEFISGRLKSDDFRGDLEEMKARNELRKLRQMDLQILSSTELRSSSGTSGQGGGAIPDGGG
ncbi:Integrase, catalytic core [Corchorus capsularis]|uniref:Integrase, catalytic core n=1 Tax=Corchorus capsularis TaxID=210143 RepID=A0A1R3JQI5_COCAP|nr:Integrase, catalytic core [Corchorus capsularis]